MEDLILKKEETGKWQFVKFLKWADFLTASAINVTSIVINRLAVQV